MKDFDVQEKRLLQEMQHAYWAIWPKKDPREPWSLPGLCITKRFTKIHHYRHGMKQQNARFLQMKRLANTFSEAFALWNSFSDKWSWNENPNDSYFNVTVSQTNFHVKNLPLQAADHGYFSRLRILLRSISENYSDERKQRQDAYIARRRQRMQAISRTLLEDSLSM